MKETKASVPWKQALFSTLQRTVASYEWLEATHAEHQAALSARSDASVLAMKMVILRDAFSVYLTTLISGGGNQGFSLKRCLSNYDLSTLESMDVVKKCARNRHCRCAHEADTYGHQIQPEEILNSTIRQELSNIEVLIALAN